VDKQNFFKRTGALRITTTIIIIITMIFLEGCWSRKEIEDLAIVSAAGFDKIEVMGQEKYRLSFLVVRPRQLGGGQQGGGAVEYNPDWLISEIGDSWFDAGRNVSQRSPRVIVMYHNEVTFIGQETAKKGINDIVDYMQRHKDVRLRSMVIVAKQSAQSIMQTLPEVEQILSNEVTELLSKGNNRVSKSYAVDLKEFSETLITPGQDAVAPAIKAIIPVESAGGQRGAKETQQTVILDGLAVFKQDRLAGYLTPSETKGFLFMMGKAQGGIVPVEFQGPEKGRVSLSMSRSSSEYKPTIRNGRLIMEINIKTEADVVEVDGGVPVGDPAVIKELSRAYSESVRILAQASLDKARKELKADIFGMGIHVHKKYPKYWHEIEQVWYDIYAELPVTIKVDGQVRRTTMISDPLTIQ